MEEANETTFRMTLKPAARKRKLGQTSLSSSSSSSGSSSSSDEEEEQNSSNNNNNSSNNANNNNNESEKKQAVPQTEGWRVKLYRLNQDGSWDDCGTGRIVCLYRSPQQQQQQQQQKNNEPQNRYSDQWLYQETGEATLCVHAEATNQAKQPRVLLRTRILLRDAYQRQGDNIITWCEPYYSKGNSNNNSNSANQQQQQQQQGVDLALSFQDNAGCMDIWRQITHVQSRAAELMRQQEQSHNNNNNNNNRSVQDMATQAAAHHHADLQKQHHDQLWSQLSEEIQQESSACYGPGAMENLPSLPNPPSLQNLEEIADMIATSQHAQQRERMAIAIAQDECSYLKALIALFPEAEQKANYEKLATLAACVKTILLLNEPSILELIITVPRIFEEVCSCLEYDPDLKEKANHRWFLRERAKFRTVVPMEDPDLVEAIHRTFRVNYLRDTILRPTMDESSLSTLSSLLTFTHVDVVKGVTMASNGKEISINDSYLLRVIRMLGVEIQAIALMEWVQIESPDRNEVDLDVIHPDPSIIIGKHTLGAVTWKQYLAPQDPSLSSRKFRRRGCVSFLKELLNMIRHSLQQSDKDDFFSVVCSLEIDLTEDQENADNVSQTSQQVEVGSVASTIKSDRAEEKQEHHLPELHAFASPVNLLSLLGNVIADPNTDTTEKAAALDIVSGIAMHDPSLIRCHCLDYHSEQKQQIQDSKILSGRPDPNEKKQVLFLCPPNDLLSALMFQLNVGTDAGILLQVTEIMRIILDTDLLGDHNSMNANFTDEAEGIPPASSQNIPHDQHKQPSGKGAISTDQKQFLSMFYEQYVDWLVAPFQFTIFHAERQVPHLAFRSPSEYPPLEKVLINFHRGVNATDPFLKAVSMCSIRASFVVELMSFCVRAHLYRMKSFLLKSRVLGNMMKLLKPEASGRSRPGDRCLKLAALRFLRSILSVNDEFYHRHIIQHDLFEPVFEAFRANPVGDNLVSSAIVEMCDYIHSENIKSLLEYIVTRHLSSNKEENEEPSLEDVSSPYVTTLTVLRKAYEANLNASNKSHSFESDRTSPGGTRYFANSLHQGINRTLTGKALEDQRKFREIDEEESYFESDEKDSNPSTVVPPGVDEVEAQQVVEGGLHRTPRMFSLAQAPLLNNLDENSNRDNGPYTD